MKKIILSLLTLALATPALADVGTTFTYQGLLEDGGVPISGNVTLELSLYDSPTTGSLVAGPMPVIDTQADGGLVAVPVDFGAVFDAGEPRYLAVAVDLDGGTDNLIPLAGRIPIYPVPYAMYSQKADHATTADNVDDADADPTNEIQTLSYSGTTLSISDGNSVDLSTSLSNLPAGVGIGTAAPPEGLAVQGPFSVQLSGTGGQTSNTDTSQTFVGTEFQQTFIAPADGFLNQLTFEFATSHTGILQYNLYKGNRISGSASGIDSGGILNPSAGTFTRSSDVFLTSGQTYTFRLRFIDNRSFSLRGSSGDAYTGGISTAGAGNDLAFGVAVTIPPTSYNMTNIGLGVMRDDALFPLHVGTVSTNGNGAHVTRGGTWTNGSSRAWKTDFQPLDASSILERLARLPITSWEYTGSNEGRHIGPTAEDFRAAFGLGHSEQYIATVDADGIALAAIQALNEKLEKENAELKTRIERLEEVLLSTSQP